MDKEFSKLLVLFPFVSKINKYSNSKYINNDPQMRRVAANILNDLWTTYKGWSSSLMVGQGANNTAPHKRTACHKMLQRALEKTLVNMVMNLQVL
jgi:hypothetical protein